MDWWRGGGRLQVEWWQRGWRRGWREEVAETSDPPADGAGLARFSEIQEGGEIGRAHV